ncbi:MAG: TetR/AcrR family transcriptional regulator [Candidatus Eremiobacteraeota bacterium]|nr:TetR/AcrR family transcriptional regulator [Candidatus Eremiobacteraeota bacterium]
MTRTADPGLRADLLERVAAYVLDHGLAGLSLRPLADAVGSSPRALLYHFGSKESMIARVLELVRAGQMRAYESLRRGGASTPQAVFRAAAAYMTDPRIFPAMRLFFETYALALRTPERFPNFFDGAVRDWLLFFAGPVSEDQRNRDEAMAMGTITLALYRGLMLDLCATNDCERVERALSLATTALETLYRRKALDDAD